MAVIRRPLQIYVAFHPASKEARDVALLLGRHFRERDAEADGEGLGVPVEFRSDASGGERGDAPETVDPTRADHTAIVLLVDGVLIERGGPGWETFVSELVELYNASSSTITIYPVAMTADALRYGATAREGIQSLRWFDWDDDSPRFTRADRLIAGLTHRFCVDIRVGWLSEQHPDDSIEELLDRVEPVKVFLSHAKADGEDFARRVRDRINESTDLRSFFDVKDLPPARRWAPRLEREIARSAFLAIHSDFFSAREWCCREVLYAKKYARPIVVVDIMERGEDRSFPYLGNVPVLRVDGAAPHHIDRAIARLLDLSLCFLVWERRTKEVAPKGGPVVALPRTPEAADLGHLAAAGLSPKRVIYPDPPLAVAELELLSALWPGVEFKSLTQLMAEP